MKISSVFSLISKTIFDDVRYQSIRYKMFLKDFQINNANPLCITGQCSILDNDFIEFDDIELSINDNSLYVYEETGHNGEWSIKEYTSLKSVENFILSPGGYINMFCTHCIVFNKNKIFEFDIYANNLNGEKYIIDKDLAYDIENLSIVWH